MTRAESQYHTSGIIASISILIDYVVSISILAIYGYLLFYVLIVFNTDNPNNELYISEKERKIRSIFATLFILCAISQLVFTNYIRNGNNQRNYHRCYTWLTLTFPIVLVQFGILVFSIYGINGYDVFDMWASSIELIFKTIQMQAVFMLMRRFVIEPTPTHLLAV